MVFIDPRAYIVYASFYIKGLVEVFGKNSIKFEMKPFKDLVQHSKEEDFEQYFAFVTDNPVKRIVIDFRDKTNINTRALEWCDVYGKVNFNHNATISMAESLRLKIKPIGPNFGVKLWNSPVSYYYMTSNFAKSHNSLAVKFRTFLSGYNWMVKREYLKFYEPKSSKDSVFFISSLYKEKDDYTKQTNHLRASYIRACIKLVENFSGGLLANSDHPQYSTYKDIITNSYVGHLDYIANIKNSSFVFNTDSLWGCLGWKLAEFLSMGKVIISTPLSNDLPYPLEHKKNIYFIENEDEIELAISELNQNKNLRHTLEINARKYFTEWLSPDVVINRLMNSN